MSIARKHGSRQASTSQTIASSAPAELAEDASYIYHTAPGDSVRIIAQQYPEYNEDICVSITLRTPEGLSGWKLKIKPRS